MATLKELFWPHEYPTPVESFKYWTLRCLSPGCWKRSVSKEDDRCCKQHYAQSEWFFDLLRAAHREDPLLRLEAEQAVSKYIIPPHSIWWRMARYLGFGA